MTEFLIYQGKISILLAVFYMFYRLLLSKDTLHRLNRIILIGTAALSCILPCCVITIHKTVVLPLRADTLKSVENISYGDSIVYPEISEPVWPYILCLIMGIGALVVLTTSVISIIKIMKIISNGENHKLESGETLIITDFETFTFSWMKYIVLSRKDYESGYSQILTHEKAHISLKHSWDILFVDLITALQWFNPAIWMLKADLRAIHEFEADDAVLRSGVNVKEYQYLLIRKAVSKSGYSVANSFNHSTLKQRITMMLNKKSSRASAWKALYVIPLVGISLAASAETKVDYQYEESSQTIVTDNPDVKGTEKKLSFQEKNMKFGKITIDNSDNTITMVYYDVAGDERIAKLKNQNLEENIYLMNGFVVSKEKFDQEIKNKDIVIIASNKENIVGIANPNEDTFSGEAIRMELVKEEKDDAPVKLQVRNAEGKDIPVDPSKGLFVVDGQQKPEGYSMNQIDPETIESVRIIKTEEEKAKYGKSAANKECVIEITTKPIRFIPVSEAPGNLEDYEKYYLYSENEYRKEMNYEEFLKIPDDIKSYYFIEHNVSGTKSLHVYTLDYNKKVRLSKCSKTNDINSERLAWVNKNTRFIIDGKWDNYDGYLRTLKHQGNQIAQIEYLEYSKNKMKRQERTCNGYVNIIFKNEGNGSIATIITTMLRDWQYSHHVEE